MNYPRKNLIHLKQVYTFSTQPDKIRKSKIFDTFDKIYRSFLKNLEFKETKSQIKAPLIKDHILLFPICATTNFLHVYYGGIVSCETLNKIKLLL